MIESQSDICEKKKENGVFDRLPAAIKKSSDPNIAESWKIVQFSAFVEWVIVSDS
jgi:hypothetical protein